MYILNYVFSFFTTTAVSIRECFAPPSTTDESVPFLAQRHLSGHFLQYEDSTSAVHAALCHTLVYYATTAILFSFVVEDFPLIDSLYFASTVFTTVGYGDMSPTNNISRVAVIALAFYGITILGVFLGIFGGAIVDSNEESVKNRWRRLRQKMVQDPDLPVSEESDDEASPSTLMGDILNILYLEGPVLLIVVAIGQVVGYFEGWGIVESLYWTVITSTSIGFGDRAPTLSGTRLAGVFFLPFFVAVLGEFLGRIAFCYLERKRRKSERAFLQQSITLADLRTMDVDKDGHVDKAEFLAHMLVTLQRVDQEDVDSLLKLFHKLDRDKSGLLNANDLKVSAGQRLRNGLSPGPAGGELSL